MAARTTKPKDGEAVPAAPGVEVKASDAPAEPRPDEGQLVPTKVDDDEVEPAEYEKRRAEVIATLEAEIARAGMPKTLVGKIAMVAGLVGQIKKSGRNAFHNYSYAKEADLVEAIRPMLAYLRIWVWWSLAQEPDRGIIAHERLSQTKKDRQGNVTGEQDTLTKVTAWFKFVDDEGQTTEPQLMMGYGDDNSDKGLYKALTGMEKYFLFKSFLVSTGDDPEGDAGADRRAAAREAGASTSVQVRSGRGGDGQQRASQPTHGGRQQDASKPQIKVLAEAIRAAGIRTSTAMAELLGELLGETIVLEGDDKAAAMSKVMADLKPNQIAKAIFELRKRQQTADGAGDPDAGEPGAGHQDGQSSVATETASDEAAEGGDSSPGVDPGPEPETEHEAGSAV